VEESLLDDEADEEELDEEEEEELDEVDIGKDDWRDRSSAWVPILEATSKPSTGRSICPTRPSTRPDSSGVTVSTFLLFAPTNISVDSLFRVLPVSWGRELPALKRILGVSYVDLAIRVISRDYILVFDDIFD
jgi:hypothetical protein